MREKFNKIVRKSEAKKKQSNKGTVRGAKQNFFSKFSKELIVGLVGLIACLSLVFAGINNSTEVIADMSYLDFMNKVAQKQVESVTVINTADFMNVKLTDGTIHKVINPGYPEFKKDLLEKGVTITPQYATSNQQAIAVVQAIFPIIMMTVMVIVFIRLYGGNSNKGTYKDISSESKTTFDDVAGMSGVKDEVMFAVSQLRNSERLVELGARPCKGIILEGPPGTGKTLLARAIAGEAGVPFISTNGANFIEMFAGLGASRIRKMWKAAEDMAPCVLFIDEIDAIGKKRSNFGDGASTEGNQTLNELLSKMDGMETKSGILVIGATNRIDSLDPALVRPGRFDKRLFVGPPRTKKDRDEIVELHSKGKSFEEGFSIETASRLMFGMTGAEIESVMNESVIISLAKGRDGVVSMQDVDDAVMKVRSAGGVATTHSSKEEIWVTAVHEAGHAIMNLVAGRKVSKVSIIPYSSGIGGITICDGDDLINRGIHSKQQMQDNLNVLLAGMLAEEIICGTTSTGCSQDLAEATKGAYSMLYRFGMGDKIYASMDALKDECGILLDSESVAEKISAVLENCRGNVKEVLMSHKKEIVRLARMLEDKECVYDCTLEMLRDETSEQQV